MLGDLSDAVDNTDRRLNRETSHVMQVSEKAKSGGRYSGFFGFFVLNLKSFLTHFSHVGMMCCIVLLIIAIIVVAAVPF
jgi:hypothetical protein